MKAIVRNAEKKILPRWDAELEKNVPTLMVVVSVDFVDGDTGALVHSQSFAHLPGEVDYDTYKNQAAAMQEDVDHAKRTAQQRAEIKEQEKTADEQIAKLLSLGDKVPLNDRSSR